MVNVFDFMKDLPSSKRLLVSDLLFAEYKCPMSQTRYDMWSHHNYFVYVIKGKKKWFAGDHEVLAKADDCIFVKKGAHSIYQYFDDEFCSLFMFVPDQFIKDTLQENQIIIPQNEDKTDPSPILRVETNEILKTYFLSFLSYISNQMSPDKRLAELKFRELIMLVSSGAGNKSLSDYFQSLYNTTLPSIQSVMESNYTYPMSLHEFARLSNRSLSAFKRDFTDVYGTTPGKWLRKRRLDYSRYLLEQTGKTVTEVVMDSGFKNISHFSRAFKEQFGISPAHHKKTPK